MDPIYLIFSFIMGTVVGSFLNVVSLRFNTGTGVDGRSKCMSCGRQLTWRELFPILSFARQKGKCRTCGSKISWQYPLVEFGTGVIFVLIFFTFPPFSTLSAVTTLIYLISACLLVVICVYDLKHKIIPDQFVYAFALLSLIDLCIGGTSWFHLPSLEAFLAGPILAAPFALVWLLSRGAWMGLGDAKLVLGIGWFLGISAGINAIILAFWIAAIASLIWIFVTYGRFKARTEIPFGPYLILGMYLVLLFGIQVLDVNMFRELVLNR